MGVKNILQKNFAKKNFAKKIFLEKIFFPSLNMYQAKSGVKNFSLYWGGVPPPEKVAQNELKHILVLEFLRSDDFWGGVPLWDTNNRTYRQTHAIVTR